MEISHKYIFYEKLTLRIQVQFVDYLLFIK
jgi:hypothetical protein